MVDKGDTERLLEDAQNRTSLEAIGFYRKGCSDVYNYFKDWYDLPVPIRYPRNIILLDEFFEEQESKSFPIIDLSVGKGVVPQGYESREPFLVVTIKDEREENSVIKFGLTVEEVETMYRKSDIDPRVVWEVLAGVICLVEDVEKMKNYSK